MKTNSQLSKRIQSKIQLERLYEVFWVLSKALREPLMDFKPWSARIYVYERMLLLAYQKQRDKFLGPLFLDGRVAPDL